MGVEEFIGRELKNHWASVPTPAISEATLLEKIGEGFSEAFWLHYRSFRTRLDDGSISESERQEYLAMVEQVERKHVARLGFISDLAELRGTGFTETIRSLGLEPIS